MGAKWLEILKQIAPHVTRVGVLRYPTTPRGSGQIGAMQAATASFGVDDAATIERGVSAFAQEPNAGLVIFANHGASVHRELITILSARLRLPVCTLCRSYSQGANPAELPTQEPTKFKNPPSSSS